MKFRFSRYLVSSMDASSGMTNWEMTDANFLNFWGNGSQIVKKDVYKRQDNIHILNSQFHLAILDFTKIQDLPYQPLHTVTILFNNLQSISHLPSCLLYTSRCV